MIDYTQQMTRQRIVRRIVKLLQEGPLSRNGKPEW
jgi:hypothetical protein